MSKYNNYDITGMYYSGYTIVRAYSCGGELVFGEEPVVTEWKLKLDFRDGRYVYLPCDSTSAITESEVKKSHVVTDGGEIYVEPYSAITGITIGECVTTIGSSAFSGITSITKIYSLGLNVVTIGSDAFNGCTGIDGIYIGCNTKTIGRFAFSGCTSASALNICAGVETIEYGAFWGLTSLSGTVSVPSSVTSIGKYAFYGMTNVTRFNINPTVPPSLPSSSHAFDTSSSGATAGIYVKTLSDYRLATGWREYPNNLYQL